MNRKFKSSLNCKPDMPISSYMIVHLIEIVVFEEAVKGVVAGTVG